MRKIGKRLWRDERAFVASMDLLLISSILVLGLIVGLVSLRDQIVQEFGDMAVAIGNLNQGYSFAAVTVAIPGNGDAVVAGSSFSDQADFCELGTTEGSGANDPPGSAPACIDVTVAASTESS
jgi:hypothetical protein